MRALLLIALTGCGLGWVGGEDDRTAGLPTSGAGPYERLSRDDLTPANEPRFHDETRDSVEDPSMLAGGPGIRVWFTLVPDGGGAPEIQYVEAKSPHELPSSPVTVLSASEAWEEGVVSAPSVSVDPAGGLVMYYEGGVALPSIGRAVSDDGITWVKDGAPLLEGASSPSVVFVYGETWMFVTRPGEPGIWRAVDRGGGFVFDAAPVVVPRPEELDAFDRVAVAEPFALAVPTLEPGVSRVHLWFAGTTDMPNVATSIGYVASFDGVTWERFGGLKPMLAAEATSPTVILGAASGLMLFAEPVVVGGRFAIAAAEH
jgi:hypothetical protein